MLGKTYPYISYNNARQFFFVSDGPNGKIIKSVVYSRYKGSLFNLGFGDVIDGVIHDDVVSNNDDLVLVMNTVAKTVYEFFDQHPDCQVYIEPVDKKRSRLYNTIFQRRHEEILLNFVLEAAIDNEEWKDYDPTRNYNMFKLSKREIQ